MVSVANRQPPFVMIESIMPASQNSVEAFYAAKPTLTSVARAANVSLATASYAMRGDPKIALATRQRVCAIAKRLGYTPNPELGRLMFLLRENHRPQNKCTLAFLTLKGRTPRPDEYGRNLFRGMRDRATSLGFGLDQIEVDPAHMGSARLTQILHSRGVRGVILAPVDQAVDCRHLLDWSQFSVVAATGLVRSPSFCRVVPHQLQIAGMALSRMAEAGHRRVGWVTPRNHAGGVSELQLAAHELMQGGVDVTLLPAHIFERAEKLGAWFRESRADSLLVPDALFADELQAACEAEFGWCPPTYVLNAAPGGRWPGVQQHPQVIGKLAVEALARQIQSGERGPSEWAAVTMVEGVWIDPRAATLRASASTGTVATKCYAS